MACSKENKAFIHKYLDEELTLLEKKQFENHILTCGDCYEHLRELRKTVAIIQSTSHIEAPSSLTANVMKQLPKQSKSNKWKFWMKKHPFMITAATFFFVFIVSVASALSGENEEIVVQGDGQFIVDKERNVVVIPEGESISGDLLIRNGNIEISGEVLGDITVINGEHVMASTDQVSGDINEINQTMELIWYEMKSFFSDVVDLSDNESNAENQKED
ncbi:anti-sigma factor [Salipaludibacillus neizhouensis]|uniref:Anti-sigma-W factor RsiW n=1 Tax=Salipaludibacillus neizhouensis TaxID=885475 RepID=A0A3A9JY76_9BACI|nr:zf-HC2 domain-containing protein [Salipaludibacillus neizhouensis]RKL65844.1 anti-sigma factor [Salipaludibacillus neizhouensis]